MTAVTEGEFTRTKSLCTANVVSASSESFEIEIFVVKNRTLMGGTLTQHGKKHISFNFVVSNNILHMQRDLENKIFFWPLTSTGSDELELRDVPPDGCRGRRRERDGGRLSRAARREGGRNFVRTEGLHEETIDTSVVQL